MRRIATAVIDSRCAAGHHRQQRAGKRGRMDVLIVIGDQDTYHENDAEVDSTPIWLSDILCDEGIVAQFVIHARPAVVLRELVRGRVEPSVEYADGGVAVFLSSGFRRRIAGLCPLRRVVRKAEGARRALPGGAAAAPGRVRVSPRATLLQRSARA